MQRSINWRFSIHSRSQPNRRLQHFTRIKFHRLIWHSWCRRHHFAKDQRRNEKFVKFRKKNVVDKNICLSVFGFTVFTELILSLFIRSVASSSDTHGNARRQWRVRAYDITVKTVDEFPIRCDWEREKCLATARAHQIRWTPTTVLRWECAAALVSDTQ